MIATANPQPSDEHAPFRLNAYQQAAARDYNHGDFARLASMEFKDFNEFQDHLRATVSDELFTSILIELNDVDCESIGQARDRIARALMNNLFGTPYELDLESRAARRIPVTRL
ncbi:hypothetical protein JQ599_18670 [Bradyrhizobium diazoefficiens]|nr:hypothetical protein [Bradyrhizobium diazoefficiens]MBR0701946.1 hypothetical protein [Bradyrhizobium diazoefficiens]MBR0770369.1 hypothetical protein [Bradyrhizobium diazoefficiens]